MNQTRNELLTEHRKAENDDTELTHLPSFYSRVRDILISEQKPNPLEEALRLTMGDRQKAYGHPLEDFSRTAGLWTSLLDKKLKAPITPEEVALAMICLKMSREQNKHKDDNLVDMAGYVNCLHMLIEAKGTCG